MMWCRAKKREEGRKEGTNKQCIERKRGSKERLKKGKEGRREGGRERKEEQGCCRTVMRLVNTSHSSRFLWKSNGFFN